MDETKRAAFRISFPDPGLTPEQEQELKDALKSAVVAVLTERLKGLVNVQPKVNDVNDDRTIE